MMVARALLLSLMLSLQDGADALALENVLILAADWSIPGRIINTSVQDLKFSLVPVSNISRPVAIDYDPAGHVLYWTDVFLRQVRKTNVMTEQDTVLAQLNWNATLDGIVIDPANDAVFFTDAGNDVIGRINTETLQVENVVSDDLRNPRAIVAYREKRLLLWTDWGDQANIDVATYDGTDRKTLVSTGLGWPNGITLDKQNDVVYWCDGKTSEIESIKLDGSGRRLILHEPLARYFDIFFMQGVLFYTDWHRSRSVMYVSVRGGRVRSLKSRGFHRLAGIHVLLSTEDQMSSVSGVTDKSTTNTLMSDQPAATQYSVLKQTEPGVVKDEFLHDARVGESLAGAVSDNKSTLSVGMVIAVVLGCFCVCLLCIVIVLAIVYSLRQQRQRSHARASSAEYSCNGAFKNNTYSIVGVDTDDTTPIYLVPCAEFSIHSCIDENPYEEIVDALK